MVSGVSTVTYIGGVELMTPISPPAPGKLSTDTNTKSVAMPANYLKGIPGLADDAKQVMWNQLTYDQQTSSASVWNNLPSTGSGSGGVADLSSAEQKNTKGGFTGNYDQYGLVANRSSMSIAPNDPTAKGVNTLVGENLKNLLFVDLQADPTEAADSNLSARLSSALSIMQGRLGGSQGLLAVDLNGDGFINGKEELLSSTPGTDGTQTSGDGATALSGLDAITTQGSTTTYSSNYLRAQTETQVTPGAGSSTASSDTTAFSLGSTTAPTTAGTTVTTDSTTDQTTGDTTNSTTTSTYGHLYFVAPDGNATDLNSTVNGYISGKSTAISLNLIKDSKGFHINVAI